MLYTSYERNATFLGREILIFLKIITSNSESGFAACLPSGEDYPPTGGLIQTIVF